MRFLGIAAGLVLPLLAAPPSLRQTASYPAPDPIRGGAPDSEKSGRFFTWGREALLWENGRSRPVASAPQGFASGGCVMDADGDGNMDLILSRSGAPGTLGDLVWFPGPAFLPAVIDTGVAMQDCLPATLFGRSGFLTIHRETQVRFYHRHRGSWSVQEIYSIYTDSRQSGLALADIDADGRPDIIAGNYWVRSPADYHLPWHIFAIHLHHETRDAARFAYAAWPDLIVGAQIDRPDAPIRLFTRPQNARLLWTETTLPGLTLDRPRSAARLGNWAILGHANGFVILDPRTLEYQRVPAPPPVALWEANGALYSVSPGTVSVWRR